MVKSKKAAKRRVLQRGLSEKNGSYRIAVNRGTLYIFSFQEGGRKKTIGIYGDPRGLRFLARLLNDIADTDQSKIPDINCPPGEGVHYHLYKEEGHMHPKSHDVILGRVDAKGDGHHEWILPAKATNP